jgi:fumarate hydratase, class II
MTNQVLYGKQTTLAIANFPISNIAMPANFIQAVALIKQACAKVNLDLGLLEADQAQAIINVAAAIAAGNYSEQFPVDIFQTGSGTSTNMNVNEVIANIASSESGLAIHQNDHVNMGQSSNDVIPTAIHLSAALAVHNNLLPALDHLHQLLIQRANECSQVKTGRTHLMDAMPVKLSQEIGAWAHQIADCKARITSSLPRLQMLAQGGTAVGTGINSQAGFGEKVSAELSSLTGVQFTSMPNKFIGLSCQDTSVELSGQLKTLACALMKIVNDLRWMNSGPLAGLGEISLTALQAGSSIMPGKVNPVIPEAVAMLAAQVMGNDVTIGIAGQSGNFQLNVMLPLVGYNLLQSIELLSNGMTVLADKAIADFTVNEENLTKTLAANPILVTALNKTIGYEKGAEIAKAAYAQKRAVFDVAQEMTDLSDSELTRLLDPASLT